MVDIVMIKHIGNVPTNVNLAFSGGIDSIAAALFYKNGGRNVTLYHFNHGCEYSDIIEKQCIELANKLECYNQFSNFLSLGF